MIGNWDAGNHTGNNLITKNKNSSNQVGEVQSENDYWMRNDAKFRAAKQGASYEEFQQIVKVPVFATSSPFLALISAYNSFASLSHRRCG